MPSDPYKAPTTALIAQPDRLRRPSALLALCTVFVLTLSCWCFYISNALTLLTTRDASSIEQIDKLTQRFESHDSSLRRETLLEYFARNRSFMLDVIGYQRSAQVNFTVVGALLILIFALQAYIVIHLRRRSADPNHLPHRDANR